MKHRIHAAMVSLAIVAGAPLSVFAAGPQHGITDHPNHAAERSSKGHTDPELARLIGIEPDYVFLDSAPSGAKRQGGGSHQHTMRAK